MRNSTLLALAAAVLLGPAARAYDNRCVTRFRGSVASKCPGHELPADRLRNFHQRSHEIQCGANADGFMRLPQNYDFVEWSTLRNAGQADKAFDMRRQLPKIAWSGRIPYQTTEVWTWEECALGTNGGICGTDRVCQEQTRQDCTGTGKDRRCRTVRERVCHDEPRTCWYDQDRNEAVLCSNEAMEYKAEYVRPTPQQWNRNSSKYAEYIPNKYDLMPGEVEVVQTYDNNGRDAVLNPYVVVGDAWNKYDIQITGSGVGAQCVPFKTFAIDVKINTVERLDTKASPNAFRLPVDMDGKAINPITQWTTGDGVLHGQPTAIMLDDASAAIVKSMAEHSQENSEGVVAKAEAGKLANPDALTNGEAAKKGFFKNTVLRVELVKKNRAFWDTKLGWNIYNDDVRSVTSSENVLSKDQEIMLADKWEVDLLKSNTKSSGQGKRVDVYWHGLFDLQPDRVYAFRVSMYQRGVPFYQQDCDADPYWGCSWMPWPIGRSENSYFSKPMEIRFETNPKWQGRNGWSTFFYNGGIGIGNLFRWTFDGMISEPTRGENRD